MEYRVSPYGWICTFPELEKRLSDEYQLDIKSPGLIQMIWEGFGIVEIENEEERKKLQPKYNLIYSDFPRAGFWDMTVLDYSNSLPPGHPSKLRYIWSQKKENFFSMEYRLNPETGVIYSQNEYAFIEANTELFNASIGFCKHWDELEILPISTEEERVKLQYVFVQEEKLEQAAMDIIKANHANGNSQKQQQIRNANNFKSIPCDLLSDFVPSRNNVGRPHFSRDQELDQRGPDDKQTNL